MTKLKSQMEKGISLLEILVVVAIFAILGIMVTRAVVLTLSGSKKSESLVKVRENLDYSMNIIERQIRNADAITTCPNSADTSIINYTDQFGNAASFACVNTGNDDSYVASGSARLTNDLIKLTACSFVCIPGQSGSPDSIIISLEAQGANSTGMQNTTVSTSTKINLRTY